MTYQLSQKLTKSYLQLPKTTPFSGKTIGQSFNEMADRKPDKEMYVFYADKERITCRQMQQESQQFAGGLLKLGFKKGDTIGILGENHYEWLLAHFAAVQLGVVVFEDKATLSSDSGLVGTTGCNDTGHFEVRDAATEWWIEVTGYGKSIKVISNRTQVFSKTVGKATTSFTDVQHVTDDFNVVPTRPDSLLSIASSSNLEHFNLTVHLRLEFALEVLKKMILKLAVKAIVMMRSPEHMFDRVCKIVPELRTNPADKLDCKSIPTLNYVINAGTTTLSGAFSVTDIMEMGKTVDKAKVIDACEKTDMDDQVTVFFTSGSTGLPKGVTHSHKSLYLYEFIGQLENLAINYDNKSPWAPRFAQIPGLGTVSAQDGVLFPIYVEDGTTIMVAPLYDLEMFLNAVQDERITGSIFLIHHLSDFVNHPKLDDYNLSSFEIGIFGGSSLPSSLLTRARKYMKHILLSYAATEGFAATQTPKDPIEILEAPAYPVVEGSEVKVVNEDGQTVPIGTIGEICFRGEMMFMYYWGDEQKTRAAVSPSGWYRTGDAGTLDGNGYIRIEGRKAEFINKAAFLLAPGNVEKVLDQHPAVNNVMVVGVPDGRLGEEVCACVRLHPSVKVTKEELIEFCNDKVATRSVPRYILFMEDEFPATEIGKFDRNKIAELARISLGLQSIE